MVILDHKLKFAAYRYLCIFHVLAALKMFPICQTKTTVFKKLYRFCSSVTNMFSVITQRSLLKAHLQHVLSTHQGEEMQAVWCHGIYAKLKWTSEQHHGGNSLQPLPISFLQ